MSERKLFAHELEARLDELLLLSLRQRSASDAANALETLPRAVQDRVLHWVAVAAQLSNRLGETLAEGAAAHADDLDAWASAGLDAYDANGIDAAERVWRQGAAEKGSVAGFAEMESRLQRYVQGLGEHASRSLTLAVGDSAWTDTATLWLPASISVFAEREANRRLYLLMATLLWGQIRYGSFSTDPEAVLAQWDDRDAALAWLAVFEAMRIEARLADELPGIAREMAALRGVWPAELVDVAADLARPDASAANSLRWLAKKDRFAVSPAPTFPYLGRLDPAAARRVRSARIARDSETVRRALNVIRGAGGRGPENPDVPPTATEGEAQGFDPAANLLDLPADAQAAAQSLQQDLGQIPPEVMHPAGPGVWQPVSGESVDEPAATGQPDATYDEWDYRRQAFRRDWCQLYETEAPDGDPAWVEETRQRHAHLIRSLRRRFEALRGEDKIHRRQLDGEEIDLDAQVEAHADRRSGAEPSLRLFRLRRRDERSLAVMFMVDMSGSTKGWVNDAERESLVLLGEAIEALDDRYAIYGFSGWTRSRCDIYRIKRFDQAYDAAVRRRIAGIEARDYTRMGVAVRHLSGLLAKEPARHKLLVTLSDGRPDDHGDEYRGRYGIEDTRRALLEAREQGIRSYCVTIDRHGADYLPQLYGPAHYTVIDDAKKLPLRLAEIYRKLTA